jgi:hypothetical protein
MSTAEAGHPAWCHPQHCFVTGEGVRVHQQGPTRWEDEEVRCESRLLDPADDERVYLELHLQWAVSIGHGDTMLRNQLRRRNEINYSIGDVMV